VAKEAVGTKGSPKRAERKVVRKLEKMQIAFRKSERRVGKLRVRLERAESKLAARVQTLNALESRLRPVETVEHGEEGQLSGNGLAPGNGLVAPHDDDDDPVVAYTPLAGHDGATTQPVTRGKKGARRK
jgi:hypothetical protein